MYLLSLLPAPLLLGTLATASQTTTRAPTFLRSSKRGGRTTSSKSVSVKKQDQSQRGDKSRMRMKRWQDGLEYCWEKNLKKWNEELEEWDCGRFNCSKGRRGWRKWRSRGGVERDWVVNFHF